MSIEDLKYRMGEGARRMGEPAFQQVAEDLRHVDGAEVLKVLKYAMTLATRMENAAVNAYGYLASAQQPVEVGSDILVHVTAETGNAHAIEAGQTARQLHEKLKIQTGRVEMLGDFAVGAASQLGAMVEHMTRLTGAVDLAKQDAGAMVQMQAVVVESTAQYIEQH